MTVFRTVDPRGFAFFFTVDQVLHAEDGHANLLVDWRNVEETIRYPDAIFGNPPNPPGMPTRVAQERYSRFDGALRQHVIVVAKIGLPGSFISGVGVISDEHRVGWTAHPQHYEPKGTKIWPPRVVYRGGT